MEVESNGRLPNLDATIRRHGNRVTTSFYRKLTDTGRYLSFDSHHPVSAKRSTVSALLSRALSIVSDSTEQTAELDVVKNMLLNNGYPATFIDNELAHLRGKKDQTQKQAVQSEKDDSCSTIVVIPLIDKTTQAIQRVFRPLHIRIVGRPRQWKWPLQNILMIKDSSDPQEETGVVYAINCRDCEEAYKRAKRPAWGSLNIWHMHGMGGLTCLRRRTTPLSKTTSSTGRMPRWSRGGKRWRSRKVNWGGAWSETRSPFRTSPWCLTPIFLLIVSPLVLVSLS